MDAWSNYYRQTIDRYPVDSTVVSTLASEERYLEEQHLYDHLLERVKIETPEELLARFRALFINGVGYSDYRIWQAMKNIVNSPIAQKDFKFILNRSAYILINHWLMQPQLHPAIPELVGLLDRMPSSYVRSQTTRRLRELVQAFRQTDQYRALKRLAQVVNQPPDWGTGAGPLSNLIRRYPCLYEYNLLTEDSTTEQRRQIRAIRRQVQRQFERDLARYASHRLLGGGLLDSTTPGNLRSNNNPTLLSDRQVDKALRLFGGKIDGSNTYRDLAQRFLTYSSHACSYRTFKQDLYDYLTESIDSKYGRQQFNQRLYICLRDTLADYDAQPLNDVLLAGTCRKLLNFLLVESSQKPSHAVFVDLTGNLGTIKTIGLLLKIVLVCRSTKPYLERRFAILFNHYEAHAREGVIWLVESLENLNIAFSINFGSLSL